MAKYFSQSQIDEFREAYYFYSPQGNVSNVADLAKIMRSLGYCPTLDELRSYVAPYTKARKLIDFPSFLDVMHKHTQANVNISKELLATFQATDRKKSGTVNIQQLKKILCHGFGEPVTERQVDELLTACGVASRGEVNYMPIINYLCKSIK